jgi:RHS repeat-associated protein
LTSAGVITNSPTAGGGVYTFTVAAANGVNPNASQTFTLTWNATPAITSTSSTTFTVSSAGSFPLTATGYPAATYTVAPWTPLPTWLTLSSSGLLSGTPPTGSDGVYHFVFAAHNIIGDALQTFTLTVSTGGPPPHGPTGPLTPTVPTVTTVAWYLPDHLGTVRALADVTGALLDRVGYDAYGTIVSESNPGQRGRSGFQGADENQTTGMLLDGIRVVDLPAGRWMTEDSWGLVPDSNPFRDVGNDPTNATDPTGHELVGYGERSAKDIQDWLAGRDGDLRSTWGAPPWKIETKIAGVPSGRWVITPTEATLDPKVWMENHKESKSWEATSRWYTILRAFASTDRHYEAAWTKQSAAWQRTMYFRYHDYVPGMEEPTFEDGTWVMAIMPTHLRPDEAAYVNEVSGKEYYGLEVTNPAAAKVKKLMAQSISMRPARLIREMVKDKLATRVGPYVYIATAFGSDLFVMVYRACIPFTQEDASVFAPELAGDEHEGERQARSHWVPDTRGVRDSDAYKLVMCSRIPITADMDVPKALAALQSTEAAEKHIQFAEDKAIEQQVLKTTDEIVMAYHTLPFGAAWDAGYHGQWGEMTLSLLGDAAMFAGGGLAKAAGAGTRLARALRIGSMSVQLVVAAARGTQAVYAFQEGDKGKAKGYGYMGEAFLRLLGASAEAVGELQALAKEAKAARTVANAAEEVTGAVERTAPVQSRGAWAMQDWLERGKQLEPKLGKNTPLSFPYIDEWQAATGEAVSIKTTDISRKLGTVESDLKTWVDEIANFPVKVQKQGYISRDGLRIELDAIKNRGLRVGIEPGITTPEHLKMFERVKVYGRESGLDFVEFVEVK